MRALGKSESPDLCAMPPTRRTASYSEQLATVAGLFPLTDSSAEKPRNLIITLWDSKDLQAAIEEDVAGGKVPFLVWATLGTTSTTAIDPIAELSAICQRYEDVWLHADGAYGGVYSVLPSLQQHFAGFHLLNSININPHKGLFTHFDCALLYVYDRTYMINSLRMPGDFPYLKNKATDSGLVVDYKDWGLSFGRRFRAMKLWFVLRMFGTERIKAMLQQSVDHCRNLQRRMEEDGRFELFGEIVMGLICFRVKDSVAAHTTGSVPAAVSMEAGNALNRELLERCNDSGEIFYGLTVMDGVVILRLSLNGVESAANIERDWRVIQGMLNHILAERGRA